MHSNSSLGFATTCATQILTLPTKGYWKRNVSERDTRGQFFFKGCVGRQTSRKGVSREKCPRRNSKGGFRRCRSFKSIVASALEGPREQSHPFKRGDRGGARRRTRSPHHKGESQGTLTTTQIEACHSPVTCYMNTQWTHGGTVILNEKKKMNCLSEGLLGDHCLPTGCWCTNVSQMGDGRKSSLERA